MLLIGLFAHYSWNKETGLEKGTGFFSWLCCFSCCSRFGSPVILFKKKKNPLGGVNAPSRWLGPCHLIQSKWHEAGGFTALTRLLTIQGVLVPSYEKSVPPKAWFLVHPPVWETEQKTWLEGEINKIRGVLSSWRYSGLQAGKPCLRREWWLPREAVPLRIQKTWAGSRVVFAAGRFPESHRMVWVE